MPVNRKALGEAERSLRRQSTRAADELRSLRLRAGLSQAEVAREIGVARSVVTRFEAGDPGITLRTRFRVSTALGAELRLNVYAGSGALIRDAAQAGIIESILAGADVRWRRTVEATVPGPGNRSVDLRLIGPYAIVLIEVESRLGSLEEIVRELHSKREAVAAANPRDGPPIHVVLCMPRTRHHESIVSAHPRTIAAAFPASSSAIEAAIRDMSIPWPGDGILRIRRPARPRAPKGRPS
jgi:transcriptional regulator with XRE-family HTH domain